MIKMGGEVSSFIRSIRNEEATTWTISSTLLNTSMIISKQNEGSGLKMIGFEQTDQAWTASEKGG